MIIPGKKGELRAYAIALILFCGVFTGYVIYMNGIFENYGVTMDSAMTPLYDTINDSMGKTIDIQRNTSEKIETSEGITGTDTSINTGVNTFEAMKLSYNVVTIVPALIYSITEYYIPGGGWFAIMILAIICLLVAFEILSGIRGWRM